MIDENIVRKTEETPKRFPCFGTATTQDTCLQCPDDEECVKETMKRYNEQKTMSGKELKERAEKLYEEMCEFSRQFKDLDQKRQEFEVHHAQFLVKFRKFKQQMEAKEVGV